MVRENKSSSSHVVSIINAGQCPVHNMSRNEERKCPLRGVTTINMGGIEEPM
ncbi:hypothetical protein PGT21_021841 [Puccinia graminis f. sp. tritici]|uniref:Uncharacterized protein n=1 Tax=Puccinia graminis f. sp. tritici TaxID=56615 RepID=A0A5B0MPA3_PUCGR|nr:hypothetical protein PGT21_021841 [Puccinia graminis f. sp. tritici]